MVVSYGSARVSKHRTVFLLPIFRSDLLTRRIGFRRDVGTTDHCDDHKLVLIGGSKQMAACGLGVIGVTLLVLNNSTQLDIRGVLIAILGTLSMASGVVLTKKWGRPTGMTMLGFTGWQLLFGGVALLPIALWLEGIPAQLTPTNYLGYAYLSLIGAILGYFLWFRGIEKLAPVTVSFLGFLSSVSACFLGYLILDQSLTWLQSIGAVAVLVSIFLSTPRSTKTQPSITTSDLKKGLL